MSTDEMSGTLSQLDAVLGYVASELDAIVDRTGWAEDEISQAHKRHPEAAHLIRDAFPLLSKTHPCMNTEFVYRSHCAELLDRVAGGTDTRPATAAEVAAACMEASLSAPLNSRAAGLYLRMWRLAGFPPHETLSEASDHHEAWEGSLIDELERLARKRLTVPDRRL